MQIPAVTAEQMRSIDERATKFFGIELRQLMECAGLTMAGFVRERLGHVKQRRVVILVGKGNNGGDGLVAARHLTNWGAKVALFVADHPDHLKPLTREQLGIAKSMFIPQLYPTNENQMEEELKNCDLVVDALLGSGSRGVPTELYARMIERGNNARKPVLAVDLPSGLDPDSGAGACIRAKWTLALTLPKRGCLEKAAKPFVGELWVGDAGVPTGVFERLGLPAVKPFAEKAWVKL